MVLCLFKQKTAYELRISDWSSDVCSSDLVDQLRAAQVPLLLVPDDPSVGGIAEKIGVVAGAIGRETEGDALSRTVEADLAKLKSVIDSVPERPRVLFILAVSNGRLLAAGSNTSAAGIIELAGGRNAVEGYEGYKMLSAEAAVVAAPDLLLFMDRTLDELGGVAGIVTRQIGRASCRERVCSYGYILVVAVYLINKILHF